MLSGEELERIRHDVRRRTAEQAALSERTVAQRRRRRAVARAQVVRLGGAAVHAVAWGARVFGRSARTLLLIGARTGLSWCRVLARAGVARSRRLLSGRSEREHVTDPMPSPPVDEHGLMDRDAQMEQLDRRQLELREQRLGVDHPDLAILVQVVAERSRARGDGPAARFLYERALGIIERTLGPEHPEVAEISEALAELSLETGDPLAAARWRSRADAIGGRVTGAAQP
jgi:hypothetical protein